MTEIKYSSWTVGVASEMESGDLMTEITLATDGENISIGMRKAEVMHLVQMLLLNLDFIQKNEKPRPPLEQPGD